MERVRVKISIVILETAIVIFGRACGIERVIGISGRVMVVVESSQHFSIFTALNVESKVLVDLQFDKLNCLNLGKRGVDKYSRLSWQHCFQSVNPSPNLVTQTPGN